MNPLTPVVQNQTPNPRYQPNQRNQRKQTQRKKKKEESSDASGSDDKDDESDNSEEDEKPKKPVKRAQKRKAPAKRTKKKKDPNAPKRPLTSYMCYVKEKRADYKAKHPNLGFGDLSKKIAEAWKKIIVRRKSALRGIAC